MLQLKRSFISQKELRLPDVLVHVNSWTDEEDYSLILYIIERVLFKSGPQARPLKHPSGSVLQAMYSNWDSVSGQVSFLSGL